MSSPVAFVRSGADLDAQLEAFVKNAPALQKAYNRKHKVRVGNNVKVPKSAEYVLKRNDLALIKEATRLQHAASKKKRKAKQKKKFDIANFVKKPRGATVKGSLKKKTRVLKASVGVDRRMTLLYLMRKLPDAKKPLTTWLK